jgi:hypothetical protein
MSINDFLNKIKDKMPIDNTMIMYLCIIVGVGVSSFCLGRISMDSNINKNQTNDKTKIEGSIGNQKDMTTEFSKKKMYIASKNGKMYYSLGCSGANRIKQENQIWFSTAMEAEKSGYAMSSTCK